MERFGLEFFRRRAKTLERVTADDDIHILNPDELRQLRRIETGVVIRAAIAGGLSALVCALAEMNAGKLGLSSEAATTAGVVEYWAFIGVVTIVATIAEIAFLYWDSLRSVHELARAADLMMFGDSAEQEATTTAAALARAALELPNPKEGRYAIDPHREVSKIVLVVVGLLYKVKVGLTAFLLKALIRRALSRAALKMYLVLVSVPVTAAWNAAVAWWVIREARLRVMGPSAAKALVASVFENAPELSPVAQVEALRAVAGSIVRTHDLHPNLVALFEEVRSHIGEQEAPDLDDTALFVEQLRGLSAPEQELVLRILALGTVLDGRLSRDERELVAAAKQACGRDDDVAALKTLQKTFVRGRPITGELLQRAVA